MVHFALIVWYFSLTVGSVGSRSSLGSWWPNPWGLSAGLWSENIKKKKNWKKVGGCSVLKLPYKAMKEYIFGAGDLAKNWPEDSLTFWKQFVSRNLKVWSYHKCQKMYTISQDSLKSCYSTRGQHLSVQVCSNRTTHSCILVPLHRHFKSCLHSSQPLWKWISP